VEKALLDTDTLSEILKGVDRMIFARSQRYLSDFGRYTTSTLSVMEIVAGYHRRSSERGIQRVLSLVSSAELLTLDLRSAETAGRIAGDLQRTGRSIGIVDPMIAAIAIQHGLTLVTGNTAHYARIQSLRYPLQLDNWRNP
jgi:tRNA(fMet)-specific endonuclease VapC